MHETSGCPLDDPTSPTNGLAPEDREPAIKFLIHDNDGTFAPAFDSVFQTTGVDVIHTPFRAPNANAYAERWIRTVREECLDR